MTKINASVLAFEKKLVCSDGYFYGTNWNSRFGYDLCLMLRDQKEIEPDKFYVYKVNDELIYTVIDPSGRERRNQKISLSELSEQPDLEALDLEKLKLIFPKILSITSKRGHTKKVSPLKLIEKSVRGTISNRLPSAVGEDPLKLKAKIEKPNPQKVDSCALGEHQDTLKIYFTLKVLGGIENPSACNSDEFKKSYAQAVKNYVEQEGFIELAKRYATNIANARFFWRNRVGAEQIEVIVKSNKNHSWTFNATEYKLNDFTQSDNKINELAHCIAKALSSDSEYLLLEVEAYAKVGNAQEVYPSEELVLDKGKGDKSKILYSVNDTAAMHSQKIGNALRTIDTWYPEFETANIGPIAVEVYGAVTNLGKAYRTPKDKVDFYNLFDRFATGEKLANKEQEHYVMAVLVRGGVFGQSSKEKE